MQLSRANPGNPASDIIDTSSYARRMVILHVRLTMVPTEI